MKYNPGQFKKKLLAASVSSCVLAAVGGVQAQDGPAAVEEVQVFGIRASMQSSMDTKRNSAGVVDAITAEDIGKFPDTNLAESLQRISGVSISRVNGEGSEVTVRGFGSEFNMITLNGRQMPAAGVYAGGGSGGVRGANNRSFDFANLASESVSSVEVYKTSKAAITTGGMGATINIGTARPLDNPGLNASIGAKIVNDTTNEFGDDFTPEVSGIFSFTDDEETFGVGLSLSHQVRHSGNTGIDENGWDISRWDGSDGGNNGNNLFSFTDDAVIINAPADGQLFGRPNDLRFSASSYERERTNAQLVLQFAPSDSFKGTLDYTFAQNELLERRGESTSWLANGNSISRVEFDDNAVATPIFIFEEAGPRDQGFEQQLRMHEDTLSSIGLNLEFAVTDSFTLTADYHDSEMESLPQGPGNTSEIAATVGVASQINHALIFNNGLPYFTMGINDDPENGGRGDGDGVLSLEDVGSQVVRTRHISQVAEIQQLKIDGALEFDNGRFDFGVETRDMENTFQNAQERYMEMGGWGINTVGDIDTSLLEIYNFDFDDYSLPENAFTTAVRGNAEEIAADLIATYGNETNGFVLARNEILANDDFVSEETLAAYFQITLEGELGGMPANLVTGVRYEETDVTSRSLVSIPVGLNWLSNNDFNTDYGSGSSEPQPFENTAKYSHVLPSMDFDIEIVEDLKARFSYSKSIARAGFGNLTSSVSGFGSGGGSTILGATRTANSSNPGLLPLESDNVDVSLEYYYDDASYASFGLFEKRVDNFIGNENVVEQHFNEEYGFMLDQTSGPRAEAALAELENAGIPADDTSLFTMMAVMTQAPPEGFAGDWSISGYAATFGDDAAFNDYNLAAENVDIPVDPSVDPISDWLTNKPVNNREAKLYGAELNLQHFFGESGFGLQANYTVVRGDVSYDDLAEPGASQFALLGLSDTANLVAVYDKDGIQARVAYNWRDEYLRSSTQNNDNNPVYVEAYSQIDVNVSYDINDNISVFVEGLNVTGEDYREHQRTKAMINYMLDLGARYQFGARYTF